MFTKKELKSVVLSILVLAFIFGFDDGEAIFSASHWFANFTAMLIFVTIAFLVHILVQKRYAEEIDCKSEYKLWKIGKIGLKAKSKLPFTVPFGIFWAIILVFMSAGKFFFTALGYVEIEEKLARLGRKMQIVSQYEIAKGALLGSLANVALIIIFSVINKMSLGVDFTNFININLWIVLFNMIPIPPLEGGKIFFGSRKLYVFGVGFIVSCFLLQNLGLIGSLGLGAILGLIILAIYYYKWGT